MRSTETSSVGTKKQFHCAPSTGQTTVINPSRNALRAKLVDRAEDWQWSSLWRRERGNSNQKRWLGRCPMLLPRRWLESVNDPQTEAELEALRRCGKRGQPFGGAEWVASTAKELGLESTASFTRTSKKATPTACVTGPVRPVPVSFPRE
jgi:hypothetical protein